MPYGITQCYLPPGRGDILGEEGREQEWGREGPGPQIFRHRTGAD